MDSSETISRDFLRGQELIVNAFNRLLASRVPIVPIPMEVRAEVITPAPKEPEATLGSTHCH